MKELLVKQRELTARLNVYRDEYYNKNAPSVSDAVYDRLFDELIGLEEQTGVIMTNSPTQTVGYPVVSGLPEAKHDIPLLSLDKTKLVNDLLSFQSGRVVNLSLKLDGLTTEIIYEGGILQRLSTRGDGDVGDDITHNAAAIEGIPMQIPYKERLVVVGESFIRNSDFERLRQTLVDSTGKPYKNSRNLAAGSVRAYNSSVCAQRCVHDVVDEIAFTMEDLAAEQIKEEQRLEDFRISLRTAVSEYSSTLSEQSLEVIRTRGGIKCATGQKTSRIIGKLCREFGVDEHERYSSKSSEYFDALIRKSA